MAVKILSGDPPKDLSGDGSGSGYGSGYGYGDGYGSGYGDGDGYGYGYGYGYGSGSGYGSGYGYGYGYGDGYGAGSGSGSGYGYGYGYGAGSGYGSGYGYGDGYGSGYDKSVEGGSYWRAVLDTMPESKAARARGATEVAFWKSKDDGTPANNGSGMVASVGLVQELPGETPPHCGRGAFHATLDPTKWKGTRLWVVALYGEVRHENNSGDGHKCWGMKREFLAEVKW